MSLTFRICYYVTNHFFYSAFGNNIALKIIGNLLGNVGIFCEKIDAMLAQYKPSMTPAILIYF